MEKWIRALQASWLDRLQTRLVLPTARTLYLFGAVLCIAAAAVGLVIAMVLQMGTWQHAAQRELPDVVSDRPAQISFDRLDARLSPPSNIRFVTDRPSLPAPLSPAASLGHFEADTPNGMADFPYGFQIIGGADAEAFEADLGYASGPRTVLRASPALADEINNVAPTLKGPVQRSFVVQVLARDAYGNRSEPTDVTFTLTYGPQPVGIGPAPQGEQTPSAMLKQIAIRIAGIVDPTQSTPDYFDAYNYALAEPARCGAKDDAVFIDGYRLALDHAFTRLNRTRLPPFYAGLCEAWRDAVAQGHKNAAASMADRVQVMAENSEAQARAAVARNASKIGRNVALAFAASAMLAFMTIALFLAFLAIEGHSSAVRQAIELLAAQRQTAHPSPGGGEAA